MKDEQAERIAEFIAPLRVKPGSTVDLSTISTPATRAASAGSGTAGNSFRQVAVARGRGGATRAGQTAG